MDQSPLAQQPRPEVFEPKIVHLYDELFGDIDLSEGFWAEFFLLRPDRRALRLRIDALSATALLALESQTRQLFTRAVAVLLAGAGMGRAALDSTQEHPRNGSAAARPPGPSSPRTGVLGLPSGTPSTTPASVEHALATLTTFLSALLAKKYTNPSSDAIALLAGLDRVDAVLSDFVGALDHLLRAGATPTVRARAVDVALAMTAGAYQTTLLTYFIQRDLFGSIIRVILEAPSVDAATAPFTLIGLLANYNKFEFQNPYQLRLTDFVNETAIRRILWSVGAACRRLRTEYLDVQDDAADGWTLASTLGLLGLGGGVGGSSSKATGMDAKKPAYDAEAAKKLLAMLPGDTAAVLLATYDFTHTNKLFCVNLVTLGPEPDGQGRQTPTSTKTTGGETPFASFLSLTSYLLQNAHRSPRTTRYTHLGLMTVRLLIEDPVLCKRMCSSEDAAKTPVRLCRQRAPHLPHVKQARPLAASLLDAMVDGITHNLRRRLDVGLYTLCVGILLRLVTHLSRTHTRLTYPHWPELFRALMQLVRFLTTYAGDLKSDGDRLPHELSTLLDHVVNVVALGLSAGEAFLPTPAAYDDLFYKVVEAGELLERFRNTFGLASRPTNSIDTLLRVNAHYQQLLADGGVSQSGRKGSRNKGGGLTSLQVAEVIRQGYDTLTVQATEGLDSWEAYREADERMQLKTVARTAVADVKHAIEAEEG